ncbi:T9SS type A sorting domain-containing protein [Cytophaga sp. FL35]|uniref:T9SS type A sorting domain-containing protein n=1 Tax=Cytophaga sp. FL35 TaxID=1904456 RepID=UPI001653E224|nr:T9SS type A sorting domain-containing protein [Cytophaga sp. FL35]MBC6997612.1 T9SS type A sorting domain-containing protein [Cytophaga sp. FL35]
MRLLLIIAFMTMATPMCAQESFTSIGPQEAITEVKLYPNPAYGESVKIVSSANEPKGVTAYDVFGKPVLREKIRNNTLYITSLKPGIYVLQIELDEKTVNRKLIVK